MYVAATTLSASKLNILAASDHSLACPPPTAARSTKVPGAAAQLGGLLSAILFSPVIALMWLAWLIDGDSFHA